MKKYIEKPEDVIVGMELRDSLPFGTGNYAIVKIIPSRGYGFVYDIVYLDAKGNRTDIQGNLPFGLIQGDEIISYPEVK